MYIYVVYILCMYRCLHVMYIDVFKMYTVHIYIYIFMGVCIIYFFFKIKVFCKIQFIRSKQDWILSGLG